MLDETDRQIIRLLQKDARCSNAEIADHVGLSPSSVYERVKKLRKRGVIKGFVALVDPEALGKSITAIIRLTVAAVYGQDYGQTKEELVKACLAEPDILECYGVAGEDCYILKVRVASTSELERLLDRLRRQGSVAMSVSNIVLSTIKETTFIEPLRSD